MRYYKLSLDMNGDNDIICHSNHDFDISQNTFITGNVYECCNNEFHFTFDRCEGSIATDYLANDKGWFIVSSKLKDLITTLETDIQYLPVRIFELNESEELRGFFIANILRIVDALCLDISKYFETEVPGLGVVYTVSKYGIYEKMTNNSDIFKLANRQEIPVFVSERFKEIVEANDLTGMSFKEIEVR